MMWIRIIIIQIRKFFIQIRIQIQGKITYNFNVFQQNSSFKICFQKKVLTYQYAALYDIGLGHKRTAEVTE